MLTVLRKLFFLFAAGKGHTVNLAFKSKIKQNGSPKQNPKDSLIFFLSVKAQTSFKRL